MQELKRAKGGQVATTMKRLTPIHTPNGSTIFINTFLRVDYLKYDNCHNEHIPPKSRYPMMRNALN